MAIFVLFIVCTHTNCLQVLSFSHSLTTRTFAAALFDLLMEMVRSSRGDKPYCDLDSVASACLLSLVIAVGDTGKMLQALTTMLIQDHERVMMPVSHSPPFLCQSVIPCIGLCHANISVCIFLI